MKELDELVQGSRDTLMDLETTLDKYQELDSSHKWTTEANMEKITIGLEGYRSNAKSSRLTSLNTQHVPRPYSQVSNSVADQRVR